MDSLPSPEATQAACNPLGTTLMSEMYHRVGPRQERAQRNQGTPGRGKGGRQACRAHPIGEAHGYSRSQETVNARLAAADHIVLLTGVNCWREYAAAAKEAKEACQAQDSRAATLRRRRCACARQHVDALAHEWAEHAVILEAARAARCALNCVCNCDKHHIFQPDVTPCDTWSGGVCGWELSHLDAAQGNLEPAWIRVGMALATESSS